MDLTMRKDWTFPQYIEEIILLSEFDMIPGVKQKRAELIAEVWDLFPQECEDLGLRDRAKAG
jgi:hypothetical protein